MNTLQDDALVLRLTEYSETSQIVTLFGAAHGLLRLIAKGARRSTRQRFATGLDLLERGDLRFIPARGDAQLGTLTEWSQRDAYTGLRRHAAPLHAALYAVELIPTLTAEADPHPDLFAALLQLLTGLAHDDPPGPAIVRFQQTLLRSIGYAPDFTQCVECRRSLAGSRAGYFSPAAGGVLCRDCELHHHEKRRLPPNWQPAPPTPDRAVEWFELLDYYLTHLAGRRFRTAPHLARLLAAARARPAP